MGDVRFPWYVRKYFYWSFFGNLVDSFGIFFLPRILVNFSSVRYARKYCRPRRDMVDTSAWKMISTEDEEESERKKKSFKQVANTIKTR